MFLQASGILKGFDPLLNLVLDGTVEYMRGEHGPGVQQLPAGHFSCPTPPKPPLCDRCGAHKPESRSPLSPGVPACPCHPESPDPPQRLPICRHILSGGIQETPRPRREAGDCLLLWRRQQDCWRGRFVGEAWPQLNSQHHQASCVPSFSLPHLGPREVRSAHHAAPPPAPRARCLPS